MVEFLAAAVVVGGVRTRGIASHRRTTRRGAALRRLATGGLRSPASPFRIELRRSAALGAGAVILIVAAALLDVSRGLWAGRWLVLAIALREYLFVLVPLALAAGGGQARRERRSGVAELFASTPRPRWRRTAPTAAAMAVGVAGGYLAVCAAAAGLVVPTARYFSQAVLAVLAVGALSLVAAVWLGMAVGRLLPLPFISPALALGGVVLLVLFPYLLYSRADGESVATNTIQAFAEFPALRETWSDVPATQLSPVLLPGGDLVTVASRVTLAQAGWLAALAVTGLTLVLARRRLVRVVALLPATIAGVVAVSLLPGGSSLAYDPAAAELVCADGRPRVCVARVHAGLLPEVVPPAREAFRVLGKLSEPPTAAVENLVTGLQPRRYDTVLFSVTFGPDGHLLAPERLRDHMIVRAGVAPCGFRDSESLAWEEVGRRIAWSWLKDDPLLELGDVFGEEMLLTRQAWRGLRALPVEQQRQHVTALRRAGTECRSDAFRQVINGLRVPDPPV